MTSMPNFIKTSTVNLTERVSGFFGTEAVYDDLVLSTKDIYDKVVKIEGSIDIKYQNVIAASIEVERQAAIVAENTDYVVNSVDSVILASSNAQSAASQAKQSENISTSRAAEATNAAITAESAATNAEGFSHDARNMANNALLSEEESKKYFNLSYALYEDLAKGQVYRGTWNPNTGSYPNNGGTNSVWDVVLNDGQDSFVWNSIIWRNGDRLLYVKDSNTYQQVKTTIGGVSSVNGKTGAVTIDHTDVGAVSTIYGLGENQSLNVIDLDSNPNTWPISGKTGWFRAMTSSANKPDGQTGVGILSSYGLNNNIYVTYFGANGKTYTRKWSGTSWGNWESMYGTGNKPTAIEIGALPNSGNAVVNGNFTISGNLTVQGNEIEFANLDVNGELREKGERVYSPNNKPTASAIGAVGTSGNHTISGLLTVNNNFLVNGIAGANELLIQKSQSATTNAATRKDYVDGLVTPVKTDVSNLTKRVDALESSGGGGSGGGSTIFGAVGTYILGYYASEDKDLAPGFLCDGFDLYTADCAGNSVNSFLDGRWRLMGKVTAGSKASRTSLWVRVS